MLKLSIEITVSEFRSYFIQRYNQKAEQKKEIYKFFQKVYV